MDERIENIRLTPEELDQIDPMMTSMERMLYVVYGGLPPANIGEIKTRTKEDLRRILEESRHEVGISRIPSADYIEALWKPLNNRERTVLTARNGLEDGKSRTLEEVGREIGRSKSTAWRIERAALAKLRAPENVRALREHFG